METTNERDFRFSQDPLEEQVLRIGMETFCMWDHTPSDPEARLTWARDIIAKDIDQLLSKEEEIVKQFSQMKYRFRVKLIGERLEREERLEFVVERMGYPKFSSLYNVEELPKERYFEIKDSVALGPIDIMKGSLKSSKRILENFFVKLREARDIIPSATEAQLWGITGLMSELNDFNMEHNLCRGGYFSRNDLNMKIVKC